MVYTPTWKPRKYPAGSAHTEELHICVQRIQVSDGHEEVRFDDHGCGGSFKIPTNLPRDVRKEAAIDMGYHVLIRRLRDYRAQAATMGISLPEVKVDDE